MNGRRIWMMLPHTQTKYMHLMIAIFDRFCHKHSLQYYLCFFINWNCEFDWKKMPRRIKWRTNDEKTTICNIGFDVRFLNFIRYSRRLNDGEKITAIGQCNEIFKFDMAFAAAFNLHTTLYHFTLIFLFVHSFRIYSHARDKQIYVHHGIQMFPFCLTKSQMAWTI